MCAVVLKVKYIAQAEKDALIECETAEAARDRQTQLEATGTVDSITWFNRADTYRRTVTYELAT